MHSVSMPLALPEHFSSHLRKDTLAFGDELWFVFKDSKLLVHQDTLYPFQKKPLPLARSLYMGTFDSHHIFAGEISSPEPPPAEGVWMDIKMLYGKIDDALIGLAGRAVQLIAWDRTHAFCGQCGSRTIERTNERAKECPECGMLAFPKIAPAIMALVQKEDELLLARSPHFPEGMYSVLAGFVDPGETLEQCLKREVFEEVGLHVDQIEYFGSQPWPFPHSLMIAFSCRWTSGEIKIDPAEIADAQWFKKDRLPLLPHKMSISRILIDAFLLSSQKAEK